MVLSPKKDERIGGTVDTTFSAAHLFSGVQNTKNSKLVVSLIMQPFAMIAMTTALSVVAMRQFSGLLLSALDGNLEHGKNTIRPTESSLVPKTAEPAVRIVVDNSARVGVKAPKLAKPIEPVAKPAQPSAKSSAVKTTVDDLKRISGIGPKLEKVLHDKGITGFSDIAKLSNAKADALDQELGLGGRIKRDQWVENAKALVKERV